MRLIPFRENRGAVVALVALAILAAACGTRVEGTSSPTRVVDDTPDGGSGPKVSKREGPSDPGVTDTEIRIGSSGPLSGVLAFAGSEAFGSIDAYFSLVNSRGGVNGRKLKLISYDNRMDVTIDLSNIRKLYEEDKVVSMLLLFADSVGDYVSRHKIPSLVFGVTPDAFASKWPTVYPLVGNALLWTQEVIAATKELKVFKDGMRVAILYDSQILNTARYIPFMKQSWESQGAKVVTTDVMNFGDGDCTSLVLKVRDLKIDWWDFQGLGWVLCASAAQRQGYKPNIGWGSWATSVGGLASQVGPWVDGMWGGAQGDKPTGAPRFDEPQEAHKEYVEAMRKYHPDLSTEAHLESPVTIGYWTGAKLLVEAIRAQGKTVTMAGINEWIANVKNFETGITPPVISMAPKCKTGSELVWVGRWKWDAAKRLATRQPETGFISSPQKDLFGGKCFLTKISDSFN